MHSMNTEQFFRRVTTETGRPPYLGGAGLALVQALYGMAEPWQAAVCVDEPASPVALWLRAHTDVELFCFPKPPRSNRKIPSALPQGPWDLGTVPMILGDRSREQLDVRSIAFDFGTRPVFYRQHSLDDLLGVGRRIGLIHIGSLHGAAATVKGARHLLEHSGAAVLVVRDSPSESDRDASELTELAATLMQAGYAFYDAMLMPCSTSVQIRAALHQWHETVFFGLPADQDLGALMLAYWENVSNFQATSDDSIRVKADEIVDGTNLYPTEYWEELCWRWTGPLPKASVLVPLTRPGRYRMSCRLLKVADDRVFDTLRIFINGMPIKYGVQFNEYDIVLEGGLIINYARFSPVTEIRFAHSETYFINPDDPRRLGLALMEINLERQE